MEGRRLGSEFDLYRQEGRGYGIQNFPSGSFLVGDARVFIFLKPLYSFSSFARPGNLDFFTSKVIYQDKSNQMNKNEFVEVRLYLKLKNTSRLPRLRISPR